MAGQNLKRRAVRQIQQTLSSLPEAEVDDYLVAFVPAGALVPAAGGVLGLQPTSAKQATSANNESNFIVMCIFDFL